MLKPVAQMMYHPNVKGMSPRRLSPKWFVAQTSGDLTNSLFTFFSFCELHRISINGNRRLTRVVVVAYISIY